MDTAVGTQPDGLCNSFFGKPLLFKNKNYYDIAIAIEDIIRNQL